MTEYVTTSEAAEIIGCVARRVRQLLQAGKLVGKRMGRDWLVDRSSAEAYRDSARKPGRPFKTAPEPAPAPRPRRKRGAR